MEKLTAAQVAATCALLTIAACLAYGSPLGQLIDPMTALGAMINSRSNTPSAPTLNGAIHWLRVLAERRHLFRLAWPSRQCKTEIMPVYLNDLLRIHELARIRESSPAFKDVPDAFYEHPAISALGWPREVVRQWLWEHAKHIAFLRDYGTLDLADIAWGLEDLSTGEFMTIETGPSEQHCIEDNASQHEHWVKVRSPEISQAWEDSGTWQMPPVLIARSLLGFPGKGLQLVEGRTRVGILRGRYRDHLKVAETHKAWVGRRRQPLASQL